MLQKAYVETIISLYKRESPVRPGGSGTLKSDNSDITAMAYYQLKLIQSKCEYRAGRGTTVNNAHYAYLAEYIKQTFENPQTKK